MSQKILLSFAVLAVLAIGASSALAQTSRVYFAGYMGLNVFGDQDFSESTSGTSGDLEYKNGHSFAGAIGFRLAPQLRLEGEISYTKNDLDRIDFSTGQSFEAGGEMSSWLGMVNLYYDFDVDWKIKPFIGAGVGYGWYKGEINDSSGLTAGTSDHAGAFAYQVGGGLRYRVAPDLAFSGSYRYLDSLDLDFGGFEVDPSSHVFRLGLEYDLPFK